MKITQLTHSVLVALLLATVVPAQQSTSKSDPTDLTVLNHSWRKVIIGLQTDSNPLQPNEDLIRQTRAEKYVIRERDYALPGQPTQLPMPTPMPRPIPNGYARREVYVYAITVRNSGVKRIASVEWELQFLHPNTQEVMGTKRITTKVKLSPGKTKKIEAQRPEPPTRIVSANQLDKKYRDQFKEQVIIHRIVYTDGTTWQRKP